VPHGRSAQDFFTHIRFLSPDFDFAATRSFLRSHSFFLHLFSLPSRFPRQFCHRTLGYWVYDRCHPTLLWVFRVHTPHLICPRFLFPACHRRSRCQRVCRGAHNGRRPVCPCLVGLDLSHQYCSWAAGLRDWVFTVSHRVSFVVSSLRTQGVRWIIHEAVRSFVGPFLIICSFAHVFHAFGCACALIQGS
jgi:hypothetical protein